MSIRSKLIAIFILSLSFAFLSGTARGFHHSSRDYHQLSKAAEWFDADWYNGTGGKAVWNQGYPWSSDFTHMMMHFQVIFLILAGIVFAWWFYKKWEWSSASYLDGFDMVKISALWGVLVWWIEGQGFILLYHIILPNSPLVETWSIVKWLLP